MSVDSAQLPVWEIVKRSYGYVWRHIRLLAVPMAIVFAVKLLASFVLDYAMRGLDSHHSNAIFLPIYVRTLVYILISVPVIVGIHRTVLLGEIRSGFRFLRLDKNLSRYLLVSFLLSLIGAVALFSLFTPLILMDFVADLWGFSISKSFYVLLKWLAFLVWGFGFSRFALALPAAALGEKLGLSGSWQTTKGSWMRLLAIAFLIILPFYVFGMIPVHSIIVGRMLSAATGTVELAVLTVTLSFCYDILVRNNRIPGIEPLDAAASVTFTPPE